MLNYDDLYFNDEGEHWCKDEGTSKSQTNVKMRIFFSDACNHRTDIVLKYLNEIGKNKETLMKCSFSGISH